MSIIWPATFAGLSDAEKNRIQAELFWAPPGYIMNHREDGPSIIRDHNRNQEFWSPPSQQLCRRDEPSYICSYALLRSPSQQSSRRDGPITSINQLLQPPSTPTGPPPRQSVKPQPPPRSIQPRNLRNQRKGR
jgi:hypothetical protein